jgi:membrane protein implicated in regulation of membrane protease activity
MESKASKDAGKGAQTEIKVSSVVQKKLLPDEKPIRQLTSGRSNFVATDKRLLRFSAGGCEALDYHDISAVSYKTSPQNKTMRMVIGIVLILLLLFIVGVWIYTLIYTSSSARISISSATVSTSWSDAIIITLVFAVLIVFGLVTMMSKYHYYQIESKAYDQNNIKSWQIIRRAKVEEFVKTITERITLKN